MLVGINIHITSEHCTQEYPYNIVTSSWSDEETHSVNSILIGNISGVHFQSLIPCEAGHFDYLSPAMESQAKEMTNRHQMVLRERAKKQISTYPQQPLCVNVPQIPNIESSIRFTAQTMNYHDIVPI